MRKWGLFIPSILCLIMAGFYWYIGVSRVHLSMTETRYYSMQLSFSQAEIYLLVAILLALWSILLDRGT